MDSSVIQTTGITVKVVELWARAEAHCKDVELRELMVKSSVN